MTTIQTDTATAPRADGLYIWERQARPVMDAIAAPDAGPARAVVMGNAGSGKSTVLRELHRLLAEQSTRVSLLTDATDVSRVPHAHVLLVDDLHLLGNDQVESLRARSEDPSASLVVASRPWPRVDALTGITRSLERSRPAIVLGHVSRSDVLTYLSEGDRFISSSCVDHVLEFTGGVSWLVSEALALHDERDCVDDIGHRAVMRAVEERIAHRLDTIPAPLRHEIEQLCVTLRSARPSSHRRRRRHRPGLCGRAADAQRPARSPGRSAVRATIPVGRLIDLSASMADGLARSVADGDADYRDFDRRHPRCRRRSGPRRARRSGARPRSPSGDGALRRRPRMRHRSDADRRASRAGGLGSGRCRRGEQHPRRHPRPAGSDRR